ncbi:MAG: hypothetical protein F6K55_24260 [Moorea sp. SIO4A3]|nr:hypothetical protein [Moorena sp. SIO4A3]
MTHKIDRRRNRGSRIFPEFTLPPEELARRKVEAQDFLQRCQIIYDQLDPTVIANHPNWFIIIEPVSGDYFIDRDHQVALQNARRKHPIADLQAMRLNQTGVCGKI